MASTSSVVINRLDPTIVSLAAPAKLNLMLHITGQRADGYHNLQTLFQFLDYADTLHFKLRNDGVIQLHTLMAGVEHEKNLIVRAAKLLQQQTQITLGADIWIDKVLPMGGGIGGGSSNAATTLLALNHLWHTAQPLNNLAQLGLTLGADVPVFIHGQACFAEGVGEILYPIDLKEPWFVVGIPPVSISTAEIFSDKELTRNSPLINMRSVPEQGGRNDCQPVVEKRYPQVRNALNLLNKYCEAKLTGTGSCVFGSFPNQDKAAKVAHLLSESLPCFVAKGANVSLAHRQLQNLSGAKDT
ncbi:4-(cytidine 5'-diphospho)-2-C-methyl-D-erythritol kinase [Pseudomonas sp. F1_0610]|uniref:4-(cytidine 5'-diphospho)-2-C-methyl-D-erythritol kinase n=1 Tax=Pseudomonas sp. F1_0610 TaxID=3114284 RepID=UPI0039C15536